MRSSTAALPESRSIVIEGELVRVTKTIVEKQVRTSDLLQEIANTQPLNTGLLPRGCIAFSRKTDSQGANTLYVMERPAGMVAIRYKNGGSHDEQKEDNISQLTLSWPRTPAPRAPMTATRNVTDIRRDRKLWHLSLDGFRMSRWPVGTVTAQTCFLFS